MTATERFTVPYARIGDRELRLHVERPVDRMGPLPMLLDVHGGAWTHFDPRVDSYWCHGLAQRGFITASAEFRLAPAHRWPAPFEDVRAAARWLRHHAAQLGGDAASIGAIGGSSGGHMVACLALWPGGEPGDAAPTPAIDTPDTTDASVAFAVALWPILDVPARYAMVRDARFGRITANIARRIRGTGPRGAPSTTALHARLERLAALRDTHPRRGDAIAALLQRINAVQGRTPLAQALLYAELAAAHDGAFADVAAMERASPLHRIREHGAERMPPLLVVQGLADPNLTPAMTEAFASAYRAKGGAIDVFFEAGLGHSYGNLPSRAADQLIERIDGFARSVLARRAGE